MDNNVIYLSDASYDAKTNETGIAIKNLYSGVSQSFFTYASSINEAEEFALIEAINHAVKHHHRNCIFIYDNLTIDTKRIGAFFREMFDHIQFLWMKRDYLSQVDVLAGNVRLENSKHLSLTKQILNRAPRISDEELLSAFMPLTRGETYGYLCAISGTAPMMKPYPSNHKEVNEKIIALLMYAGSQRLYAKLTERFGKQRLYKHKRYDELLKDAGFEMSWFEEARNECSHLVCAA